MILKISERIMQTLYQIYLKSETSAIPRDKIKIYGYDNG